MTTRDHPRSKPHGPGPAGVGGPCNLKNHWISPSVWAIHFNKEWLIVYLNAIKMNSLAFLTADWQVIGGFLWNPGLVLNLGRNYVILTVKSDVFYYEIETFSRFLCLPESLELEKSLSYRRSRSSFHSSCGPAESE